MKQNRMTRQPPEEIQPFLDNPFLKDFRGRDIIYTKDFYVAMYKKISEEHMTYVAAYNSLGFSTAVLGEDRANSAGKRAMQLGREGRLFTADPSSYDGSVPREAMGAMSPLEELAYHWYLPGGQLLRHQGDRTYANPGVDSRPSPRGRGEGQKVQRGQRKETRYGSRKEKGPRIRHSKGSTHLAPRNSEVDPLQRTCASTDIPSERNS